MDVILIAADAHPSSKYPSPKRCSKAKIARWSDSLPFTVSVHWLNVLEFSDEECDLQTVVQGGKKRQETSPRCEEERPSRNSRPSSGDFSASHLAVTGLVKKSASCSEVSTFTILNSPLLTLSCNHKKRVETCLCRPRPRLAAKPSGVCPNIQGQLGANSPIQHQ